MLGHEQNFNLYFLLDMVFTPEELNAARQCLLDGVIDYFLAKEGIEALYIQGQGYFILKMRLRVSKPNWQ